MRQRILILLFVLVSFTHAERNLRAETFRDHRSKKPSGVRIYGGTKAKLSDSPWQAALLTKGIDDNFNAFFCGGTVISDRWILTAAHCVRPDDGPNADADDIEVLSGTVSLANENSRPRNGVLEVIPHESYKRGSRDFDIALIKVRDPIQGARASLAGPSPDGPSPSLLVRVSGWGRLAWGPPDYSPDLLYVDVPVNPRAACDEAYPRQITSNMFCAGTQNADSCKGDSGGPVVTLGSNQRLVGVVSWGMPGCKGPRDPGVYTRVASFLDWIRETTKPGP
jgi:secreted trypsin-like serine protease